MAAALAFVTLADSEARGDLALPSSQTATSTLKPVADAYVSAATPGSNTGASRSLRVDGSPVIRSYLRFDLTGVTGQIRKATLRVFVTSNQSLGYSVRAPEPGASWTESSITFANAPPVGSTTFGTSGRLTAGTWTTVDVTAAAAVGSMLDLVLITSSSTAASLTSRESSSPPELVLESDVSSPAAIVNTTPPMVSGTPEDGQRLSTSNGEWSGDPTAYAYGWRRCDTTGGSCAVITDATEATYLLRAADVGATLRSVVTATGAAGSGSASSEPTPVVAAKPAGSPTNTGRPTISGTAREELTLTADAGTWSGSGPIAFSYRWHRCDPDGSGCTEIPLAFDPTYTLAAVDVGKTLRAVVTATNAGGSTPASSDRTEPIAARPEPSGDPVIAAAGDIACAPESGSFNGGLGTSNSCHQKATSDLLLGRGFSAVLPLGDIQYECGTALRYAQSFDPSWGRQKPYIRPSIGNHEYGSGSDCESPGAAYFNYFGSAAGDPAKGYYSYDLGAWHLVALNANCSRAGGCGKGSPQETWLRADLAANQNKCTLAYWHQPHFSSGTHGNDDGGANPTGAFWEALYEAGADLVLNGHDHVYERFAPQTPGAISDPTYGIRQFTVGTGGKNRTSFMTVQPNSEVRNSDTFGILALTLSPTRYSWRFLSEAGKSFEDSGSTACHDAPPDVVDTTAPTAPTSLEAVAASSNRVDLTWDASTDDVGVAGYRVVRDGTVISTVSATSYADTSVSADTSYEYVVRALDLEGNVSEASQAVRVSTPAGAPAATVFEDGFESGDLSRWTTNSGMSAQQQLWASGSWAARQTATSAATHATKQLSSTHSDLSYSLSFNVVSQGVNNVYLLKIRTASGASILGVYRSSSGKLSIRNDAGAATLVSPTVVLPGVWHRLEIRAVIAGTSSRTEVRLDNVPIPALSTTMNLGATPIGRVQIGDNSGGRTYDVAIDDVRVALP